jgi:hypothetical protein
MQLPSRPATQGSQPQPDSASEDGDNSDDQTQPAIVDALYKASREGNAEAVKQALASREEHEWREDDVATAATLAVEGGHLDIVQLLLDRELLVVPAALSLGSVPLIQAVYELQKWTTKEINDYMASWPNL